MKQITLSVALLSLSVGATAQENYEQNIQKEDSISLAEEVILNEITVSGPTGTQKLKDSPIAFSVISPENLYSIYGTNITNKLSREPGVSQISTGAGISKPIIRGLGYNRVVVVEQGIRQEGQQWGDEHGLEVDAEGIHSVEILKGPASLMYGSDAIAGVIILHPEPPMLTNTMKINAGGEYQSNNGLYNYKVKYAGNLNGWIWNMHINSKSAHCYKNKHDGYVPGTWFKEKDIQGMLGLNRKKGHSWIRISHVNFTPGIAEGERDEETCKLIWNEGNSAKNYSKALPFQRVQHTKVVSDNTWNIGKGTLKGIAGYQQNYRREFEDTNSEAELAMRLHTVSYELNYQLPLQRNWKLATGLNGMWQQNRNEADEMLIPDHTSIDIGYFLTASKKINRWNFSGGARIDNRHLKTQTAEEDGEAKFADLNRNFTGATGSIGAVYSIKDSANIRINLSRGFRAPNTSELCSDGVHEGSVQYELGNKNLDSEYSAQIDLGMDYTFKKATITAALFANKIQNYIFLGKMPYLTDRYRTYQYQQGDAVLTGGEVKINVQPKKPLHILNTFSYVRGILLHQAEENRHLPMTPAPRWTCNITYEFSDFAKARCRQTFVDAGMDCNFRQEKYYAAEGTETPTPSFALFHLSAGTDIYYTKHNYIKLSISCQNIFNKAYQSHLSRLKYTDEPGIYNIGRNFCMKINVPIDIRIN